MSAHLINIKKFSAKISAHYELGKGNALTTYEGLDTILLSSTASEKLAINYKLTLIGQC